MKRKKFVEQKQKCNQQQQHFATFMTFAHNITNGWRSLNLIRDICFFFLAEYPYRTIETAAV